MMLPAGMLNNSPAIGGVAQVLNWSIVGRLIHSPEWALKPVETRHDIKYLGDIAPVPSRHQMDRDEEVTVEAESLCTRGA